MQDVSTLSNKRLATSIEYASEAHGLSLVHRLRTWGFAQRYGGKIGKHKMAVKKLLDQETSGELTGHPDLVRSLKYG